MEYSVINAGIAWGSVLFVLPHLAVGAVLTILALRKKLVLRGTTGRLGLAIQLVGGLIFAIVAGGVLASKTIDTALCTRAYENGEYESVVGLVEITRRFQKPGYGYVEFKLAGHELRTEEWGSGCDCGFLNPLGKMIYLETGQSVEARLFRGKVIYVRVNS